MDIRKAFDSVSHQTLINELFSCGVNGVVLQWFQSFLENRWQSVTVGSSQSEKLPCQQGVPQGSVLGPFLFSLYLRHLPAVISSSSVKLRLFADDICIYFSHKDINTVVTELERSLLEIVTWLSEKGLVVNGSKSDVMFVRSQRSTVKLDVSVRCAREALTPVSQVKYLGIILDEFLTFSPQISYLQRDISAKLASFRRGRSCLPLKACKLFYTGYIQSKLEYACTSYVHCLSNHLYNKLVLLSKKAIRIVCGASPTDHTQPLFARLHLYPLSVRFQLKLHMLVYRSLKWLNHQCSELLTDLFHPVSSARNSHLTRASSSFALVLPAVFSRSGLFSPSFLAADRWNSLPSAVRGASSRHEFRCRCLEHLGYPTGHRPARPWACGVFPLSVTQKE